MKPPRIVIVGGGPAGMVLAYQLVSNGIPVRVLERHPDFEREFRGELLQAPVVEALERAGLFSALLERGLALPDIERRMYVGKHHGDAAHTMSPSGGQGLNLALRDTFVAANHLLDALQAGRPLDAAVFERIQAERQPEVDRVQAGQTRAGQMVLKPLGVLHLMFTMLGAVMLFAGRKMQGAGGMPAVAPRYLTPLARSEAPKP